MRSGALNRSRNFYPRPPRGGRHVSRRETELDKAISIHALREEGDNQLHTLGAEVVVISIHALREEGDNFGRRCRETITLFLSTPSARRATPCRLTIKQQLVISIHALREEGDCFDPIKILFQHRFLSTPSARRATQQ